MSRDGLVQPRSLRADLADLHAGRVDAVDRLAAVCDRIDAVDPAVRAFVPEPDRRSRVLAAGASPDGDWRGIAFGVKDVIRVDGHPTTAGSTLPVQELAGPQASVVSRLLGTGAVVAGKTVTAEFAVAAPGPTANPHDLSRTPGGSSSGSAAAVAAGAVPLALGTQTVGSVIRPAAYCGVVGVKPTYARVPVDGVVPHSPSLDTLGWFTATVADAAVTAAIVCPGWDPTGEPSGPPVLGVPSPRFLGLADPAARAAFARQLGALRTAGCEVRETRLFEDVDEMTRRLFLLNRWELARTHEVWFERYADRYRPQTAAAIEQGRRVERADYRAARRWQHELTDAYATSTADAEVDVWVAPSATGVAPPGLTSTGDSAMNAPFSLVGAPVISIPAGQDAAGLPWGLQCAGARDGDERLLAFATMIESALHHVADR